MSNHTRELVDRVHGREASMDYSTGYDLGLRHGFTDEPRRMPKLRRYTSAEMGRRGYDDGYADGVARREANRLP